MKKIAIWLLAIALIISLISLGCFGAETLTEDAWQVEQALSGMDGTLAMSYEMLWENGDTAAGGGTGGTAGTLTRTKVTDGAGLFARYLSFDLEAFGSNAGATDTQIRLRDTSGTIGFKGSVAAGDVMLMHLILRSTPDDAEDPMLFHMSIYGTGSSSAYPATSGHPEGFFTKSSPDELPTVWTEYYIPLQANSNSDPDKIILFLNPNGGTGTVDIACMEIVNYGTSVTLDQLPAATIDLTDYTLPGRTVMPWDSFFYRATKSVTKGTLTLTQVEDGTGMFSRYLSLDYTLATAGSKNAQLNYLDYTGAGTAKGWGLHGNVKAGDNVLIHLILRSTASDGEGSFRLALYQQGTQYSDDDTAAYFAKQTVTNKWTEYYFPVTVGELDPTRFSIFFGYESQTLDVAMAEIIDYNDTPLEELPSGSQVIESLEGVEYDFFESFAPETVDGVKTLTGTNSVDLSGVESTYFSANDMVLYELSMRATSQSTPVTVKIGSTEMVYYVPVQWTTYGLPILTESLSSVTITGDVELKGAKFINYKYASIEDMALFSGPHLEEEFESIVLPETEVATGGVKDLVKSGNFIYSIGSGALVVTDVSDPENPVIRGKLSGLGAAIRQMDLCASGEDIFVTSRQNGAFIINVSDPDAPYVRSTYDSIELATGMCIYQDYAFICNRQYGVEIVDISDLDAPAHVGNILTTGTVQSCQVADGILYCGQWAQCCVSLYDLADLDAPQYIADIPLNGKGDGLSVLKDNGRTYLVAATGQHNLNATDFDSQSNLNFGQGNGMDIVDITDPLNPQWLSTTNIDGRYYYASEDFWDTKISVDAEGNRYAYFMNTYNGVYIFNINDLSAPVRIAHVTVQIPTTSSNYKTLSYSGRDTILPYDQSQYAQDAVASIYVEEGVMYLAGNKTGVHILENSDYLYDTLEVTVSVSITDGEGSCYDFDGSAYEDFASVVTGTQFYAVAAGDGKVYAAAGSAGVLIYDGQTMEQLGAIETRGAAIDVVLFENRLYVAERTGGLGVYDIAEGYPEYLRYEDGQNVVRSVRLSPKGYYAVLQVSSNDVYVVDIRDPANPTKVMQQHANSHLYHRNLSGPINNQYVVGWACAANEFWIDFGEDDSYDEPVLLKKITSSATNMRGGIVDLGDGTVLATRGDGYVIYDPTATDTPRSSTLYKVSGITMTGKPYLYNNEILILSNRIDGTLQIIDVRDLTAPSLMFELKVKGNPDLATVSGDYLYVPMGYQGLFRFRLSSFMTAQVRQGDEVTGYWDLQTAMNAAQQGYVRLLQDVSEDVTVTGNVYLDLNGHNISGAVSGDGTLYGLDSTTNAYDCSSMGLITGAVTCNLQRCWKDEQGTVTGAIRRYMAIEDDNGWSFHRFYLGITHISLVPDSDGVGYKATFAGDEMVISQVESYGYNLWLTEDQKLSLSQEGSQMVSGEALTLRINNFLVENYSERSVYGQVFMTLTDGTVIESSTVDYTLRSMVEGVYKIYETLTQAQKTAIDSFVERYNSVTENWTLA